MPIKSLSELQYFLNILGNFSKPWFVCGGWALDLFTGSVSREHTDVEIGIFRTSQLDIQSFLSDWSTHYIQEGVREPSNRAKYFELPIHELEFDKDGSRLEVLLNESDSKNWLYRRNLNIKLPIKEAILHTNNNLPYLAPQIVLLFKSREIRPKDQQDFEIVLPHLSPMQKNWLKESLLTTNPKHIWIQELSK